MSPREHEQGGNVKSFYAYALPLERYLPKEFFILGVSDGTEMPVMRVQRRNAWLPPTDGQQGRQRARMFDRFDLTVYTHTEDPVVYNNLPRQSLGFTPFYELLEVLEWLISRGQSRGETDEKIRCFSKGSLAELFCPRTAQEVIYR